MTSIEFDSYVFDVLMPDLVGHDRKPGAFLVYVFLHRGSKAEESPGVKIPLREVAEGTGLSKRAVQDGIEHLVGRGLLEVSRDGITAIAQFTPLRPWAGRTR